MASTLRSTHTEHLIRVRHLLRTLPTWWTLGVETGAHVWIRWRGRLHRQQSNDGGAGAVLRLDRHPECDSVSDGCTGRGEVRHKGAGSTTVAASDEHVWGPYRC